MTDSLRDRIAGGLKEMTDPAVEAARRVGKTLPYGFFSKLTSSDLIFAAREALAPLKELHKLTSDVTEWESDDA